MPDTSSFIKNIEPAEVLYYFDEPLIFWTRSNFAPLLCTKADERGGVSRYLAVMTSPKSIDALKSGQMSLRAAFLQQWCWLIDATPEFGVVHWEGVETNQVPEFYFPDPGVGLYPHHGFISDAYSAHLKTDPFLSVYFKGGSLTENSINFSVFKGLIDEVYSSLRKVFLPAFENLTRAGLSESTIGKILYLPLLPPKLASLSLQIERPQINLSATNQKLDVDWENTHEAFNSLGSTFINSVGEITGRAETDRFMSNLAESLHSTLDVMAQIVPTDDTPFDTVEISSNINGVHQRFEIDSEKGARIKHAYRNLTVHSRSFSGKMIELSLRSNSFIISASNGREITCALSKKNAKEAMDAFQDGMNISVSGSFHARSRRDYILVKTVTLPNGRVIGEES